MRAILTSLGLAAGSATIASIIGVCVVVLSQKAGKWKNIIQAEGMLPEMIPNIVFAIGLMIFIISFRELVASSLISPPNVLTISTFIVREFEQGSVSVGMAMAVICVLITTTALIILNYFGNKDKNQEY